MKHLLTSFLLFITISFSYSQTTAEDELGAWYTISGSHRISDDFSISTLAQLWLFEEVENFNFVLFTGGLNYHISPKLTTTIALSYADIDGGFSTNKPHTYENRLAQQIVFKHKIAKLPIDHRFRAEQRFFSKLNTKSTKHRLRYRIGAKIILNKHLFIRLNDEFLATLQNDIVTENRLYSALGINIAKSSNLQLGYLNRKIKGQNFHRLQVGLFFKTDLRKKKN